MFGLVDPEDIRWVFLSHDDGDHTGSLHDVLVAAPNATLVMNMFSTERLALEKSVPLHRSIWREPGETFDAGDRRLRLVLPPIFDGPATRGLFDERTGVLWAVDSFAAATPGAVHHVEDVPRDLYDETFMFFNSLISPWHQWLDADLYDRHVDAIEALRPRAVASAHGPILVGDAIHDAFDRVRSLAGRPRTVPAGQSLLDEILAAAVVAGGLNEIGDDAMKIGIGAPQLGHFADPSVTREVAITAEQAGIASLWVIDRLLVPTSPRSRYPASADGALPPEQHQALDPIVTLTVAAAATERIRIGTNVLVAPWYPPVLLARSLATLDRVSAGRLTVGVGVGWSIDEYEAVGAPMGHRGARLEEILEAMSRLWRGETELATTRETIAPATLTDQPAQRPRPPFLLATYTPEGLERIARRYDGWLPYGLPFDVMHTMWSGVLDTADRYGRDTTALQLVLRTMPAITDVALGSDRAPFTGSRQQVADDVRRAHDHGVDELILDLQSTARTPDELVDTAARDHRRPAHHDRPMTTDRPLHRDLRSPRDRHHRRRHRPACGNARPAAQVRRPASWSTAAGCWWNRALPPSVVWPASTTSVCPVTIARLVAGQVERGVGDVVGQRGDAERRAGGDRRRRRVDRRVVAGDDGRRHRSHRAARRDGVDADAARRQLGGDRLGQPDHGVLARRVAVRTEAAEDAGGARRRDDRRRSPAAPSPAPRA